MPLYQSACKMFITKFLDSFQVTLLLQPPQVTRLEIYTKYIYSQDDIGCTFSGQGIHSLDYHYAGTYVLCQLNFGLDRRLRLLLSNLILVKCLAF